jgi:hypothetical protein
MHILIGKTFKWFEGFDEQGEHYGYYEDVEEPVAYFSSKRKAAKYIEDSRKKNKHWKTGSLLYGYYTNPRIEKIENFNPEI